MFFFFITKKNQLAAVQTDLYILKSWKQWARIWKRSQNSTSFGNDSYGSSKRVIFLRKINTCVYNLLWAELHSCIVICTKIFVYSRQFFTNFLCITMKRFIICITYLVKHRRKKGRVTFALVTCSKKVRI